MLDWLFGGKKDNWGQSSAAVSAPPVAAAPVTMAPNSAPEDFDWVEAANGIMAKALSKMPVMPYEATSAVAMPLAEVRLSGSKAKAGGLAISLTDAPEDKASLTVRLSRHVGNYDIDSLNNAVHAVLGSIPVLADNITFAKDIAQESRTHEDVWKELKPTITASGKFSAKEIDLIGKYFENTFFMAAEETEWLTPARVIHADGKVQIKLNLRQPNNAEKGAISQEAAAIEYFNTHKQEVLTKMREKITALNLISPQELATLDMNAAMKKGEFEKDEPIIEFTSHPTTGNPPEKATLSTADTDKIQECFIATVTESCRELPDIFPYFANAPMVAQIIRERTGNDPAIETALNHDMFKSRLDERNEQNAMEKAHMITIGNARETDEPHTLQWDFTLPHGIDLHAMRKSIVTHAQQIPLNAQRHLTQQSPTASIAMH